MGSLVSPRRAISVGSIARKRQPRNRRCARSALLGQRRGPAAIYLLLSPYLLLSLGLWSAQLAPPSPQRLGDASSKSNGDNIHLKNRGSHRRRSRDCHEWPEKPNNSNNTTKQFFCYPDAIVVGPAKTGTTSMWGYTMEHPWVFTHPFGSESRFLATKNLPSQPLEVQHNRYRGHLINPRWNEPTRWSFPFTEQEANDSHATLVVEHLPELFAGLPPHAPPERFAKLVAAVLPRATVVVLLRDPIQRAWSHYLQLGGRNADWFPGSVETETRVLNDCFANPSVDDDGHCALTAGHIAHPDYYNESSSAHGGGVGFQSISTGLYALILDVWVRYIPKERICLLDVTSLSKGGKDVGSLMRRFEECTGFDALGAAPVKYANEKHYDGGQVFSNRTMAEAERSKLREFYAPHNRRLCDKWPETCDLDWVKRDLEELSE